MGWGAPLAGPSADAQHHPLPAHCHLPSLTQLRQQVQLPSEAASAHEQTIGAGCEWRALGQAHGGTQTLEGQSLSSSCSRPFMRWTLPGFVNGFGSPIKSQIGLPWWSGGWASACHWRGHRLDPRSGKIPQAMGPLSPCSPPLKRQKHK